MQSTHLLSKNIATIILAGGQGTRLHPLTQSRCKPAVCFAGKHRLIDVPISNSLNAGIHHIFVISQPFSAHLGKHLATSYPKTFDKQGHLEMLCPRDTHGFLGTADAVRKNRATIENLPIDYVLILSGDQLYHMNLSDMIQVAQKTHADLVIATLLVKEREAKRMGLLQVDAHHQIVDFFEKPSDPATLQRFMVPSHDDQYLGSMGIYVFRKQALLDLLKEDGNDFGKDLIPKKIQDKTSYAFIYDGYWEDIGTVTSYYDANLALIKKQEGLHLHKLWHPLYHQPNHLASPYVHDTHIQDSLLRPGSLIKAKTIAGSIIGTQSHIAEGTIIEDSIVMGHHQPRTTSSYTIGNNSFLRKVIVDEDAHIGNHVQLINEKGLMNYDGDGIFIRDGIMIVSSGTHIPDGFCL